MRRVLFFNQGSVIGGADTFLLNLIENWPGENDEKIVLSNQGYEGNYLYEELSRKYADIQFEAVKLPTVVEVYDSYPFLRLFHVMLKPLFMLVYVFSLSKLLGNYNPDVVISNNGGYPAGEMNLAVTIAARLGGVNRVIMVIHNLPKRKARFLFPEFFLDRLISWACDEIVTVSRFCSEELNHKRAFTKKVKWIYNGIAAERKDTLPIDERYATLGVSSDTPIIGYLGSLEKRKGIEYLIKAVPEVLSRHPDARLILIGKGETPYVEEIKNLIKELKIEDTVIMTGHLENAQQFIECFSLLVLPSIEFESFGLVILEAMLYKKPVVVSDFGPMKEIVQEGKTGLISKVRDTTALAEGISGLLSHPKKSVKMGETGYKLLIERFTIERMVRKYYEMARREGA